MTIASRPSQETRQWNPKLLLDWSSGYFKEKGLSNPRVDSELLLAHVLGCRRIELYLQFDRPMSRTELADYRALVRARASHTPVAYLVGETGFHNLVLKVRPGCLIPRPETETLVEAALDVMEPLRRTGAGAGAGLRVLEVGTGSGAIPLALCSESEGLWIVSCEVSPEALAVAVENLARHAELLSPRRNALHLLRAHGATSLGRGFSPDLIVSNPPYIPTDQIDGLEPEVALAEPRVALDGGPDGLEPHRELMEYAAAMLPAGGRLLLEIGHDQGPAAREALGAHPSLRLVEIHQDLGGRDRVLHAVKEER